MIVAITSKGGGPGCTTVAFFLSQILGRDENMSICLVDLKNQNDIARLLNLKNDTTIDDAIGIYQMEHSYFTLDKCIYKYGNISVMPGSSVMMDTYLYKFSTAVKKLIEDLDKKFDIVLLDVREGLLFSDLEAKGLNMLKVNVLEQNILTIFEYQVEIRKGSLEGLVVISKFDDHVLPHKETFMKNFDKSSLFFLPYSPSIKSLMNSTNSKGIHLKDIEKTMFFKELLKLSKVIEDNMNIYESSTVSRTSSMDDIIDECLGLKEKDNKSSISSNTKVSSSSNKKSEKSGFFGFFHRRR